MFRRLSILVRRASDDRAGFARAWERHGGLVKKLPGILSYLQNHVVEEFGHAGDPPQFRADGIVELRFESPEAMRDAFASEAAIPVKADEPSFLGHGTGYAVAMAQEVRRAENGSKVILVVRSGGGTQAVATVAAFAAGLPGFLHLIRDDVTAVIPRPELREGPQHADFFLHLYFDTVEHARAAGRTLIAQSAPGAGLSVYRVRTLTIV